MNGWPRHAKYSRQRIPSKMKTLGIKGRKENGNRLFYCWNCFFPCDADRDFLDLSSSGKGGAKATEFIVDSSDTGISTIESPWMNHESLMANGTDGTGVDISYSLEPKTAKGCPFCGCTTWRGR